MERKWKFLFLVFLQSIIVSMCGQKKFLFHPQHFSLSFTFSFSSISYTEINLKLTRRQNEKSKNKLYFNFFSCVWLVMFDALVVNFDGYYFTYATVYFHRQTKEKWKRNWRITSKKSIEFIRWYNISCLSSWSFQGLLLILPELIRLFPFHFFLLYLFYHSHPKHHK